MGRIGFSEILLIGIVFVLLFGTKKLPEIGASIGQAIKEFRKASREIDPTEKPKDSSVKDETKVQFVVGIANILATS